MDDNTTATSKKRIRSNSPLSVPLGKRHLSSGSGFVTSSSTGGGNAVSSSGSLIVPAAAVGGQGFDADLHRMRQLQDPRHRNAALNELLQLSSSHEANFALSSDAILKALADIVIRDCLNWHEEELSLSTAMDSSDRKPLFRSKQAWNDPPTLRMRSWATHCYQQLGPKRGLIAPEKIKTMEVILGILRNFSYVGANQRLMAYSPTILNILTGCLYEGSGPTYSLYGNNISSSGSPASGTASTPIPLLPNNNSLSMAAIQIFMHLSPLLDVTGQKLFADKLFYAGSTDGPCMPDSDTFGQAASGSWGFGGVWLARRLDTKEDTVADVSRDFVLSLTSDFLVSVWSFFAALNHLVTHPGTPRVVLMMSLDLLQELVNLARVGVVGSVVEDEEQEQDTDEGIYLDDEKDPDIPSLRAILVNMPDAMLDRLVDLLYVPRLGPDALDYIDPVHNLVTRVTTLKLLMGYDATVDTDVRDRSLDVLVPLLELDSPRMAARLGRTAFTHHADAASPLSQSVHAHSDPATTTVVTSKKEKTKTKFRVRTHLYDAIVPILTSSVGRNDSSMLAIQLFRELGRARIENRQGLLYVQSRLLELASRDGRVAHLVFNHLYLNPDSDTVLLENHDADDFNSVNDKQT